MKSARLKYHPILLSALLIHCFALSGLKEANAGPDHRISIVGLVDFYNPSVDSSKANISSLANSSNLGSGFGLLSESSIGGPLAFDFGLLYLHRSNDYTASTFKYTQSSNWLTLPVGLKFRFAELFSVGAGPYLAYRLGSVSNNYTTGSATSLSFDSTDQQTFEVGFYGSAGATFVITENIGVLVEARLLKGFSSLSSDANQIKVTSADIVGLAGIQISY